MDKVLETKEKIVASLSKFPILQQLEEKTGVEKFYLFLVGVIVCLGILLFGFGAGLLCNLIGFIYPAIASFKAIESESKKDDVQWLTYWIVYACFNVVEVFADFLLYWIPFYYAFKLGFLLWLILPSTQGASFLYNHFLSPFLTQNESRIDKAMKDAMENSSTVIADMSSVVSDVGKDISKAVAKKILENQSKGAKKD